MTTLETRGNLPPGVAKPREGYREMKIGFWGGQPEILDSRITGYEMNDIERNIVDVISEEFKVRSENRRIDDLVDGYLIKENRQIEQEPPEKHSRISKLVDFAIAASLLTEIAIALGGIL